MSAGPDYEKLGVFYLGGMHDPETGTHEDQPLLYDAKDLTTHAVCVGMTGSGKTGLCVTLLEEAAIDGIPAICIDPKGDLGNLLLAFPKLSPDDFEPWVDPDTASRKGMSVAEYAKDRAELWKWGLGKWNQSPSRIQKFRDAAEVTIYTPGSTAGVPVSVLGSFDAPSESLRDDTDAMRDRVQATVSGLLALLGVDADPIRSREHILLSNILHKKWTAGESLDLPGLIVAIQNPPFESIGVLPLDSFFSPEDRFELSMTLNNLLASPGFETWMKGEPLDVGKLLRTADGKARVSVMSIAHLGDSERMFFVTILLNEIVSWMRSQRGTSSLRALLYMDEVFGFLPPSAKPPSKLPMLTLLKQARAYGLGVVLATQNPVDLDYKALSNAGTWFLGRLQTERDKMRVIEGLEGASAAAGKAFDRGKMEATLAGLGSRVFLMNNVHEDRPVMFHTRWALSYLAGPLTRDQIRGLMKTRKARAKPKRVSVAKAAVAAAPAVAAAAPPKKAAKRARPIVPPGVPEYFLSAGRGTGQIVYRPALLGLVRIAYNRARPPVSAKRDAALLAPLGKRVGSDPWGDADRLESAEPSLSDAPVEGAGFDAVPAAAMKAVQFKKWKTSLRDHLYRNERLELRQCKAVKLVQEGDESVGEFSTCACRRPHTRHAIWLSRSFARSSSRSSTACTHASRRPRTRSRSRSSSTASRR